MANQATEQRGGARPPNGSIEAGTLYRIEDFKWRVGWSRHAMRTAQRNGLNVIRTAGRAYVTGDDALAYFNQLQAGNSHPEQSND